MAPVKLTSRGATRAIARLADEMLACYLDWREGAAGSRAAYLRWCESPVSERELRFASYLAALDQEESAAANYADATTEVARRLKGHRRPRTPSVKRTTGLDPQPPASDVW
jgi:hypothetical protein